MTALLRITFIKTDEMKYIVLIGDGMAGRPIGALGNRTCLQKSSTPHMDRLAQQGEVGWARTVPAGFEPGSDVANLSILGYNPSRYYSGRAPIEAVYQGIHLGPQDVAYRCNLVHLKFPPDKDYRKAVMNDYSAGHITTAEAKRIIQFIQGRMGSKEITFYPGVSYRHTMIWKKGNARIQCTPPHDITGREIQSHLPSGKDSEVLNYLICKSHDLLRDHAVNRARVKKGQLPANSIWLWGQGKKLTLPKFRSRYGLKGALISAVDLTKGLGMSAGFDVIKVKGATGYIDTNYAGKSNAALRALRTCDFVYVHVEAPDEAGHIGSIKDKIMAIEDFDKQIVGPILKGMERFGDYRVLLMPDHFTPISVKTHTSEPVPFVIYDSTHPRRSRARSYSENICRMKSALRFEKGYRLMDYFVGKQ